MAAGDSTAARPTSPSAAEQTSPPPPPPQGPSGENSSLTLPDLPLGLSPAQPSPWVRQQCGDCGRKFGEIFPNEANEDERRWIRSGVKYNVNNVVQSIMGRHRCAERESRMEKEEEKASEREAVRLAEEEEKLAAEEQAKKDGKRRSGRLRGGERKKMMEAGEEIEGLE